MNRPVYHFLPPANWMNDPNGLIQWQGQYHLFYQYNPAGVVGPGRARMHWGHAVSADLVHWRDLPLALAPTPGGPDADGCWSGCAVDHDGVPTVIYSGHRDGRQHTCLARGDDDLLTWQKEPANPVIPHWPDALDLAACRDPAVWRTGDDWYQLLGAGLHDGRGTALLYRSRDLLHWEYQQPILAGGADLNSPYPLGTMWECPGLVPLGDRYLFFLAPKDKRQLHRPVAMLGEYADERFRPQRIGLLDQGTSFYAPQAMADARGRRLLWGWLREARGEAAQVAAGWSGVMSLPRVLSLLPDGTLGCEPAEELQALRGAHYAYEELDIAPGSGTLLDVRGRALEIVATWETPPSGRGGHGGEQEGALSFGIDVACSPHDAEVTSIRYDVATGRLLVDRRHSSLSDEGTRDVQGDVVGLATGEPLTLCIFLDHSVLEIFANGRACHATRIYPTRAGSDGVRLFAEGGTARLTRLNVWQMASIWDERRNDLPPVNESRLGFAGS